MRNEVSRLAGGLAPRPPSPEAVLPPFPSLLAQSTDSRSYLHPSPKPDFRPCFPSSPSPDFQVNLNLTPGHVKTVFQTALKAGV